MIDISGEAADRSAFYMMQTTNATNLKRNSTHFGPDTPKQSENPQLWSAEAASESEALACREWFGALRRQLFHDESVSYTHLTLPTIYSV